MINVTSQNKQVLDVEEGIQPFNELLFNNGIIIENLPLFDFPDLHKKALYFTWIFNLINKYAILKGYVLLANVLPNYQTKLCVSEIQSFKKIDYGYQQKNYFYPFLEVKPTPFTDHGSYGNYNNATKSVIIYNHFCYVENELSELKHIDIEQKTQADMLYQYLNKNKEKFCQQIVEHESKHAEVASTLGESVNMIQEYPLSNVLNKEERFFIQQPENLENEYISFLQCDELAAFGLEISNAAKRSYQEGLLAVHNLLLNFPEEGEHKNYTFAYGIINSVLNNINSNNEKIITSAYAFSKLLQAGLTQNDIETIGLTMFIVGQNGLERINKLAIKNSLHLKK